MPNFIFWIRPLSLEGGFELVCEGVLAEPLRLHRLIEAILAAVQIGQGMNAEIRILNTAGEIAETLEINSPRASALLTA